MNKILIFVIYVEDLRKVGIFKQIKTTEEASKETLPPSSLEATLRQMLAGAAPSPPPGLTTPGLGLGPTSSSPGDEHHLSTATPPNSRQSSNTSSPAGAEGGEPDDNQSWTVDLNFKSEEPMRRDLMQLVDAMVMLYSISTHKVMQDPFAMQLLIKEYETNIANTKEKLTKCPKDEVS